MKRFELRIEFKLRDLWVGAYWDTNHYRTVRKRIRAFDLWVCLVPCLPVHLTLRKIDALTPKEDDK